MVTKRGLVRHHDRISCYIKQHVSEPFFLYLAFNAAHTPMEATEKYLARFPNIADSQRRTYAAMMSAMDDAIGRTLTAVRDHDLMFCPPRLLPRA